MWTAWLILQMVLAAAGGVLVLAVGVFSVRQLIRRRRLRRRIEHATQAAAPRIRTPIP